jgi:hypothetical protein
VNIENALWEADQEYVEHPIQQLDFITVSDLATWQAMKTVFLSLTWPHYNDALKEIYGENGSGTSSYVGVAIGGEEQKDFFTPIGVLLSGLFSKLAWTFNDMRELDAYFCKVNMMGSGREKCGCGLSQSILKGLGAGSTMGSYLMEWHMTSGTVHSRANKANALGQQKAPLLRRSAFCCR